MKLDYYILNSYVADADGDPTTLYRKWIEQVTHADALGYDTAWMTEHHFRDFGGMLPNPQLMLAACATITSKIRLGTAVSTIPLHHPLRVAEDLAMLARLAAGRIECGFGRGMTAMEYEIFGHEWDQAQHVLEESIELLERVWREEPLVWNGAHFSFPDPIRVLPPIGEVPRIWVTANRSEEHFEWIGAHGYNLMTLPWAFPTFERGRELIDIYLRALTKAGYSPDERDVLGMVPGHVADRSDEAHDLAARCWGEWRAMSMAEHDNRPDPEYLAYDRMVSDSRGVFGDPAECEKHLRQLADLGLTRVAVVQHFGGMAQHATLRSMELLARDVSLPD